MEFQSIEDIIDFAIQSEIEAARFYETAAEQETNRGVEKNLREFSEEERRHEQMLKNFKENKTKLAEYQFEKVQDIKRSDYLVDLEYRPGMSYVNVMRVAMKREEKAFKLYDRLAAATDKEEYAKLFKILAQEEAKHKNFFETAYDDYMASQGD